MLQLIVCISPFSGRSCYLRIAVKKKCSLVIIEQQTYYLEFCFFSKFETLSVLKVQRNAHAKPRACKGSLAKSNSYGRVFTTAAVSRDIPESGLLADCVNKRL